MNQEAIETLLNTAVKAALDKQAATHAQQMSALQESLEQKLDMIKNVKSSVKHEKDSDNESEASGNSAISEVEFIKQYINPKFSKDDKTSKYIHDKLIKVQNKLEASIPKLAYDKTDGEKEGPPTHNYLKWQTAILKYYTSLSPALAEETVRFLNSVDIDDFIQGNVPIYPTLASRISRNRKTSSNGSTADHSVF